MATPGNRKQAVQAILESIELNSDTVGYLAGRWQDESEYEDIRSYESLLQECLPSWAKIQHMTTRPFGCLLQAENGETFTVAIRANGTIRVQTEL